jgi:hypothetical protein
MLDYKIVVELVFPNGDEEYVIWEPVFFGDMLDRGVDLNTLFYSSPDLVKTEPVEVYIFLYANASLTPTKYGQLLVGKKICLIRTI